MKTYVVLSDQSINISWLNNDLGVMHEHSNFFRELYNQYRNDAKKILLKDSLHRYKLEIRNDKIMVNVNLSYNSDSPIKHV